MMNLKPFDVDQTQEALANYAEMGQGIVEFLEITIHDATKVAIDWHNQHREIKRLGEELRKAQFRIDHFPSLEIKCRKCRETNYVHEGLYRCYFCKWWFCSLCCREHFTEEAQAAKEEPAS